MERREDFRHRRGLRRYILELNLFETDLNDEQTITIQRWSTRIYIVFLFSAMAILLVYNASAVKTQQIEVKNPSLETYLKLQNTYETNVKCPCTHISAAYRSFVVLIPVFHDICSSGFVSQTWIDLLFDDTTFLRWLLDFRTTASNQFQILRELCQFSQTTINNDIQAFYDDTLVSAYLLSESLLKAELVSITTIFQTNSVANFLHFLSFVRAYVLGNQFMTGIETAYLVQLYSEDGFNWSILITSFKYWPDTNSASCTCSSSATCNMRSAFYYNNQYNTYYLLLWQPSLISLQVENWFVACWLLESLLISSVDNSFLNNQTALDLMAAYSNWPSNSTPIALSMPTETNQSSTFTDILQTLFIESFSTEFNYSLYYAQCQPRSCLYSINQHSSFLYIFTALLGLYGGLSVVLRLLSPYVVGFLVRYFNRTPPQRPIVDAATTTVTWKQRTRTMSKLVRDSLVDLNLFKSSLRQQPSDIKQQCWSTRIYIALLTLALVILTLYEMLNFETKLIQVSKPSLSTVLQLQSQNNLIFSLQCPCTQLSVPYGQFIQLQPFFHQVCSSDFVSDGWIEAFDVLSLAVYTIHKYQYTLATDFIWSQSLFVLLQALCEFSNETIADALQSFERTQLVGAQLLTVDDFTSQMLSAIRQFKVETTNTFIHFLQLLRNITQVNQLISGSASNFNIDVTSPPNYNASFSVATYNTSNGNSSGTCSCANDSSCETQWGLFNGNPPVILVYSVPGFYSACQPVESLLQSTLECFYDNQDCMRIIVDFYNVSTFGNVTLLNSSLSGSRFAINSTIESIVSQMFVETWTQSTNYLSYFAQCQPASCSYTISQRNSLVETITRIVGLIGGLSVSLRILVPFLAMACIGIIRRLWSQLQEEAVAELTPPPPPPMPQLVTVGTKIRDWFKKVNVFEETNRAVTIEQQCLSTRVYIIILIVSLFILVLYTSLTNYLNTFTITNPSLEQYQQLQQRYRSDAISCPCSRSSVTQSTFIQLECDFHPVCTSHFISDSYIQELFKLYNDLDTTHASSNAFTLQGTIFTHFQALLALCNLAKDFVTDAQQQYLASSVVSTYISDFDLFEKETNASLVNFRSTMPNSFLSSLQIIRGLIQGNGFISAYSTNWYPFTYNIFSGATTYFKPQYYGNDKCNCATSATCTQPSTPFVDGYLVGCTPLESLLQSTVECLYEQPCVDFLGIYLNMSLTDSYMSLNKNETRFSSTDTIDSIVQQMFIETCSSNVSYNQFFEQCKPDSCSVTVSEPGSLIIVVTTILGLYGGLTTFLQLVVPFLVFSTYKLIRKYKQRAQVGVQQIATASLNNNTTWIDNTGHAEHIATNPNPNSNLNRTSVGSSTVVLEPVPMVSVPLTRFFASIPSYLKVLVGITLLILVAVAIVIPSVYLTQQVQNQTVVIVPSTSTGTTTSINTSTTISKIMTTKMSTTTSIVANTTMSTTINTIFSTITVSTPAVKQCTNLTFDTAMSYAIGGHPQMIAVSDFNGDEILDLATANSVDNTVSVLLGIGNGSFGSKTMFPVGSYAASIAIGDFNGDGRMDLAVDNNGDNTVSVLLGTGSGSFGPQTIYSTGLSPTWIVAKDFNGDGRLDLIVVNSFSSNLGVFFGIGDGYFTSQTTYPVFADPSCVAVDDFNGDGHLDLVVVSMSWPIMSVLLGNGNGSFLSQTMFPIGSKPSLIATGDFNGDGRLDVVVANSYFSTPSVGLLLGTGNGSFGLQTYFATDFTAPNFLAVGDFNGDAQLDLVVAFYNSGNVSVFLGSGNGSFGLPTRFVATSDFEVNGVAVGDLNNDGLLDIAVSTLGTGNNANILLNTCT